MQISSEAYGILDTYRQNKYGKSNQVNNDQTQENKKKTSFTIKDSINLVYLVKPKKQDLSKLQSIDISQNGFTAEQYEQELRKSGEKETHITAAIFVDDKAVAFQHQDEEPSGYGPEKDILSKAGGDPEKIKQLLNQYYPNAEVRFFADGQQPTRAQKFEMQHGYSFNRFVNEQVTQMRQDDFKNKMYKEEMHRRKVLFSQTPQTHVFTYNDKVIASMDKTGFVNVGQALLKIADDKGIDRKELKELFRLKGHNADEYQAKLKDVFGYGAELKIHDAQSAPTRGELSKLIK
ncbi:hypothetical protein [Pseudoalteromonas umbrosa]|uniref:hypothetical protein n=1 Tax=Pseudoalteromonas umbrosa TaxID=3048489 RepID=UPI0024C3DD79|nr:hypothetical protein [Pseudoalteromonas sp. B95]MDK1288018.1 hypothetical protein [Pseudoalteromonas sp. B95]